MYVDPRLPMVSAQYNGPYAATRERIQDKFKLSSEARETLRRERYALSQNARCEGGFIQNLEVWDKAEPALRMNTLFEIMRMIAAKKPLQRADFAVPSIKAAVTTDPDHVVTVLDQNVRELETPDMFALQLLELDTHITGGGNAGEYPIAESDAYIFKPKLKTGGYQKVISGERMANYKVFDRGIEVVVNRFWDSLRGWSEVDRQMRLVANGGARSINILIYEMLLKARTSPQSQLADIGGTGKNVVKHIDATVDNRFGASGAAGKFIYEDFLQAALHCQRRPNTSSLRYIVMTSEQWINDVQPMAVNEKIAFREVKGADLHLVAPPGWDGQVAEVMVLVDDDLPPDANNKNHVIFVGPSRLVGVFLEHEPTSMQKLLDYRTNEDIIPARHSNGACIWGYSNITVGTGYARAA